MDFGEKFPKEHGIMYRNVNLRPNKGAHNAHLKRLAAADPNQVLAKIAIPVDNPPNVDGVLSMLHEDIKARNPK